MKELVFETKGKTYLRVEDDCHIAITTTNSGASTRVVFALTKYWADRISTTGYIQIAVTDDRIYFKESEHKHGWKLSEKENSSRRRFSIEENERLLKWASEPSGHGDFDIKFDKNYELYYIEKIVFEEK